MVILRATQKVLRSLPTGGAEVITSDTALGDWYVNRIVIDRQPLILLVSARSLLAILEPARELRKLPQRLPYLVEERLKRLPVDKHAILCEVEATRTVAIGKTIDRSVLGQIVSFGKDLSFIIPEGLWGLEDLRDAEDRLGETPCRCSSRDEDVVWPEQKAVQLLETAWPKSRTRH